MAYIGRNLEQFSNVEKLDNITFTNSAGPYNLLKGAVAFTPVNAQSLLIEVDGIIQASDSYTVSGSTITFGVSMASTSTMNSIVQLGVGLISTPADATVSTAKLEDGAVTGAKVNSTFDVSAKTVTLPASVSGLGTGITNAQLAGSITDAKITGLSSSKLSGLVPVANLGTGTASSSTYLAGDQTYKTITEFNDNKIVNDISTLALHQATNNNSAKYNLTNSNVDVYQDSSAIANLTNVARDTSGEYISSIVYGTAVELDYFNPTQEGGGTADYTLTTLGKHGGDITDQDIDSSTGYKNVDFDEAMTNNTYPIYTRTFGLSSYAQYDYQEIKTFGTSLKIAKCPTYGDLSEAKLQYSSDKTTWTNLDLSGASVSGANPVYATGSHTGGALSNFAADGTFDYSAFGTATTVMVIGATVIGIPTFSARYIRYYAMASDHAGGLDDGYGIFTPYTLPKTINATGSYESTAQTANASVSTISGVVTYTNADGTATLNTDIVLEVSADNGSTWQSATLTAAGTFSTGVLQAVTNDISVTAGTQLKYKISFANQSDGVKVTRINGVSLSY
jgi:hypothetical protein